MGEKILDLLFPRFCLFCGRENTYLCPDCFSKIKTYASPFCPYCGSRSPEGTICPSCKKYLTGFVAAGPYKDKRLKEVIETFKYKFVKELATLLALLIFKFLKENQQVEFFKNPLNFLIVPIPLHKRRQRERGFNQAEEIGKQLSPLLKIPIKTDILLRRKNTKPQVKLKKEERRKNIKDAFIINPKIDISSLKDKKIILLDDVFTSGSTMEEAAKVLRDRGIKQIWALAVAKE